ncbi:hypothetical protein NESM_000697800 [Novymonas esmeraldas]|uniref:Uncharacterized protein n=1 Tax=Novymonas esmeraldas TaxID=1808958 RepID=A0AAW0ETW5_9TRYP
MQSWRKRVAGRLPCPYAARRTPAAALSTIAVLRSPSQPRGTHHAPLHSAAAGCLGAAVAAGALRSSRPLCAPLMPLSVRFTGADQSAGTHYASSGDLHGGHAGTSADVVVMDATVAPALARQLSVLTTEDLAQRLHRFSRANFDAAQRPALYAHLKEFMRPQRLTTATIEAIRDHLHTAHVASMHETCIELYHAAREHVPAAVFSLRTHATSLHRSPSAGVGHGDAGAAVAAAGGAAATVDRAVLVSSFVVDSAYATQSTAELTRLASYCVSQLLAPLRTSGRGEGAAAGDADAVILPTLAVRTAREMAVELSLIRCLWRTLCLAEYFKCAEATGTEAVAGCKEQALADALAIMDACRQVATVRYEAAAAATAHAVAAGAAAAAPPALSERRSAELLAEALRLVRYAAVGDDGEFTFHQLCLEERLLWPPQRLLSRTRHDAAGPLAPLVAAAAPHVGALVHSDDEVQVLYAALIDTCAAGHLVSEALFYFAEARRLLGCPPLVDSDGADAASLLRGADAHRSPTVTTTPAPPLPPVPPAAPVLSSAMSTSAAAVAPLSAPAATTTAAGAAGAGFVLTELLLLRLLSLLQTVKSNRRVVSIARAIIAAGAVAQIKSNVWTLLLISAGAVRAADVALAAYNHATERLNRLVVGDTGGHTTGEQRMLGYLLHTSFNALSKCQLPRFEQDYLQPARASQLLQCTDEYYFICLLQDAHNSMCPAQRAAEVLTRMEEAGVPMTAPIVVRLLKLYLRVEAPEFMPVYRHAVDDLRLPVRSVWADQLLLWADRRRYYLSSEDRAYIVAQLLRSRRVKTVAELQPLLGGLRTHFALLYYDHTHGAREQFLRDGSVLEEAPTVMDSRAHFLTTRPASVQRGTMTRAGASWVRTSASGEEAMEAAEERHGVMPRVLGDAAHRTMHASIAALSETPLLLQVAANSGAERLHDEALRVYLTDVLGGLQRSSNRVA